MSVIVTFNDIPEEYAENETIVVQGVGERLFEDQGGNLTEMSEEDKKEYMSFITSLTPKDAIEEALSTIEASPGFDNIPVSEVDAPSVTATVKFKDLSR